MHGSLFYDLLFFFKRDESFSPREGVFLAQDKEAGC